MSVHAHKARHQEQSSNATDACGDAMSQRKVLLVDEQAHVLRVMRLNLGRHGYEVDTALSSEAALLMLRDNTYDALIITSDMPDMSNKELCKYASERSRIPIALMLVGTSMDDEWLVHSAIAEKLDKPISLRWIVARLSEVFGDFAE
jgi:two-component system, OmpR family, alkaline phosphatase synthesis response regulator PhoP